MLRYLHEVQKGFQTSNAPAAGPAGSPSPASAGAPREGAAAPAASAVLTEVKTKGVAQVKREAEDTKKAAAEKLNGKPGVKGLKEQSESLGRDKAKADEEVGGLKKRIAEMTVNTPERNRLEAELSRKMQEQQNIEKQLKEVNDAKSKAEADLQKAEGTLKEMDTLEKMKPEIEKKAKEALAALRTKLGSGLFLGMPEAAACLGVLKDLDITIDDKLDLSLRPVNAAKQKKVKDLAGPLGVNTDALQFKADGSTDATKFFAVLEQIGEALVKKDVEKQDKATELLADKWIGAGVGLNRQEILPQAKLVVKYQLKVEPIGGGNWNWKATEDTFIKLTGAQKAIYNNALKEPQLEESLKKLLQDRLNMQDALP
jgi:hypothetical protein